MKWARILLAAAIISASLWDFRIFEIRVFDVVAAALLLGFFALSPELPEGWLTRRRSFLLLFGTVLAYAVLGYLLHGHRSSLAIIIFSLFGLLVVGRQEWRWTAQLYRWLVIGHVAVAYFQFIAFYAVGWVADVHRLYGGSSRILADMGRVRPDGMFIEANSFCLNAFVLCTLAILHRPSRILALLVALGMVLSESLWGLVAAVVLLVLNEIRQATSPRQLVVTVGSVTLLIAVLFNAFLWLAKDSSQPLPHLYTRIMNFSEHGTFQERYIRNSCPPTEQGRTSPASIEDGALARAAGWIFGTGLTTRHFLECLPLNGLALVLKSFGVLGSILLIIGLAQAMRGLGTSDKIFVALALTFAFTNYPLVTYLIFWIWLPSLLLFAPRAQTAESH